MKKLTPCAGSGAPVDLTALSTPAQILAVCTAVLLCGHIPSYVTGICGNVWTLIDEGFMYRAPFGVRNKVYTLLVNIAVEWPSFSGNSQYPVPHPSMNPEDAYNELDLWEGDEYGASRRRLLEFVHSQALALAGGVSQSEPRFELADGAAKREPYWLESAIRLKG